MATVKARIIDCQAASSKQQKQVELAAKADDKLDAAPRSDRQRDQERYISDTYVHAKVGKCMQMLNINQK